MGSLGVVKMTFGGEGGRRELCPGQALLNLNLLIKWESP